MPAPLSYPVCLENVLLPVPAKHLHSILVLFKQNLIEYLIPFEGSSTIW